MSDEAQLYDDGTVRVRRDLPMLHVGHEPLLEKILSSLL